MDPMTARDAWAIYASVLELIAWTFFGSILVGVGTLITAFMVTDDPGIAVRFAIFASACVLPVTAWIRASRIRDWAAGLEDHN